MAELFASLPRQIYCSVESRFVSDTLDREHPAVSCSWFGLTSVPGRAWGLSVLLECGAIYSHLPPHAIVFPDRSPAPAALPEWSIERAQLWDCFGVHFAVHEYEQLAERAVVCRWSPDFELGGEYLFTAQHYGDGYSLTPEQAKQYHFVALDNGRLAALPGNHLLVHDRAFTRVSGWPKKLRRQTERYTSENEP